MKKILVGFAIILFLPTSVDATTRSISFTTDKTSLTGNEEIIVTVSPSNFTSAEQIYIKGAFVKEGSTNYFGYTKKGDAFVKNSTTTTDQLSAVIGSWDNTLIVKSDFSDSGFAGDGAYNFKVGFYYTTESGLSSVNWSTNISPITLIQPTPTPTPIPPTATPTPQPTSTPSPTNAPSATPPPTGGPTATQAPTTIPTPKPTNTPKATPTESDVLGESVIEAENPTEPLPEPTTALKPIPDKPSSENLRSFIPLVFIIVGSVLIIGSCSPFIVQYIRLRFKKGQPPV